MFGPIATDGMPHPQTYQSALRTFHNINPWRGHDAHERPLRKRGEKFKTIVLHLNGDVSLRLHSTDVVTWHPDDSITCRTYDSASTAKFAWATLPANMNATMHHGELFYGCRNPDGQDHSFKWYRAGSEPLRFRPVPGSLLAWECTNAHTSTRYFVRHIDRDVSKEIRAKLQPFERWVQSLAAVNGGDMTTLFTNNTHAPVDWLLQDQIEVEDWPHVLRKYCTRRWRRNSNGVGVILLTNWQDALRTDAYRSAGCYKLSEVPLGELPRHTTWGVERQAPMTRQDASYT